jgi:hypothetical protein
MTAHEAYIANYATPEFLAYEATSEFQTYLQSKALWESAHEDYRSWSNPITQNALTIAEWRMKKDLEAARKTPEHFAAFGY